jgi:Kef-type K+ transport system membrane component KefB
MSPVAESAIITFGIFFAGLFSVHFALSSAVLEIVLGVFLGNALGLSPQPWLQFLAGIGGVMLTFLAGAEVSPDFIRQEWRACLLLGLVCFFSPFLTAAAYCVYVLGWDTRAALIAGCVASCTSLAIVYAVLVERGLRSTRLGKILMGATFVTNMGTIVALAVTVMDITDHTLIVLVGSALLVIFGPRLLAPFFVRYKGYVIEPEIKLLFALLLLFMVMDQWGSVNPVLPAFLFGVSLASTFREHPDLHRKLRIVAFSMLTPFFAVYAGLRCELSVLAEHWPTVVMLLLLKLASKGIPILPLARRYANSHAMYFTLILTSSLTMGLISATHGLREGYLNSTQYSILVLVVIGAAVIPTFIAQRWFEPELSDEDKEELLAESEEAI